MAVVHAIEGRLSAVSHVFYLSAGKCFLVSVKRDGGEDERPVVVLVPIEKKTFHFLQRGGQRRLLGSRVRVTRLRPHKVTGCSSEEDAGQLYRVTSKSTVDVLTAASPGGAGADSLTGRSDGSFCHEGIVTDDADAASGVAVLNRRILLVATAVCHVTNARRLRRGQKVLVARAHVVNNTSRQDEDDLWKRYPTVMALCSRSFLAAEEADPASSSSIHCREESETFGRDTVVDLAHRTNCDYRTVLTLLGTRRTLLSRFGGEDEIRERLTRTVAEDGTNHLARVCQHVCGGERWLEARSRNLLEEFYASEHRCSVVVADSRTPDASDKRRLLSVQECRSTLLNLLREEKADLESRARAGDGQRISWCTKTVVDDAVVLLGILDVDPITGHYRMRDSTGAVDACLPEELEASVGGLVAASDLTAVLEWIDEDWANWERMYVIPRKVEKMFEDVDKEAEAKEEGQSFRVLTCSGPRLGAEEGGAAVVELEVDARSGAKSYASSTLPPASKMCKYSKRIALSLSDSLGRRSFPRGSQVSVCSSGVGRLCKYDAPAVTRRAGCGENGLAYGADEVASSPSDVPLGPDETVSVVGEVAERWVERNKFPEREGGRVSQVVGVLPPELTCHVKIGGGRRDEVKKSDLLSFYFTGGKRTMLPLGMVAGSRVRLANVKKMVSGKGYSYLLPTQMTNVVLLGHDDGSANKGENARDGRLAQLRDGGGWRPGEAKWCRLTLESVVKASLSAECSNCGTGPLSAGGRCAFVGCHAGPARPGDEAARCVASLRVADGTDEAMLVVQEEKAVRRLLQFSPSEWSYLRSECARTGLELLHLRNRRHEGDDGASSSSSTPLFADVVFRARCESVADVRCVAFRALARPFKSDVTPAASAAGGAADTRKLYCLDVKM